MPAALHVHSWYSLLEGASSPAALLDRAAAGGLTALALTDTNNLLGAVAFRDAARSVRPLLGACLKQQRTRCVALVADRAGYRHLCRVLSLLHLQAGPPGHDATAPPRGLVDLLRDHADGLHLLVDEPALAERLFDAFGRRLWLEVVRPRPDAARRETELLACGRRLGLRLVASTAAHFASPDDYAAFRVAAAVRRRTLIDRLPPVLAVAPEHHLTTVAELRRRFADLPEAVANTDALAELLLSDVLPRDVVLPAPRLPPGGEPVTLLRRLCEDGLRWRDLGASLEARQRLREELTVIESAGLSGYFLTVRDIAGYARRRGHRMALRGSAGNSLVCYLLAITDVDPLRFDLPPERFLHPGRADLPDIDLDFDWKVRDEVIAHVIQKHGAAHAAQISTHQFFQPRSAFREAGRVHGLSDEQISDLLAVLDEKVDDVLLSSADKVTRGGGAHDGPMRCAPGSSDSTRGYPPQDRSPTGLLSWGRIAPGGAHAQPGAQAPGASRASCPPVPLSPCPRRFPLEAERWPRLLADARRLLGKPHHLSIHPGGVVLTPGPLMDHVPLQWAAKGVVVTQLDKDGVEQVGLVKIDLLGNRALATVDEATRLSGRPLPRDTDRDLATLDLLRRGDTVGVGQLESPAMRHLLVQMRPRGLGDVVQALALLRPGAAGVGVKQRFIRRRLGLEPAEALHPRLAGALAETEGLLLYEDDALRVVQALTDLPVPDADRLRKRIAKHRTDAEAEALRRELIALCERRGLAAEDVAELWAVLAKFNRYSFCKSHAVSYGLIAWDSAYLKAHEPAAFWAAALNNNQGAYPRRVYVEAAKRAGIELRLPCVNASGDVFTLEGAAVRVGLGAIAGLPLELRQRLLADREQAGPFRDLADLRRRLRPGPEALALLIRCGALDGLGRPRPALFLDAELQDAARVGPAELFEAAPARWAPADYGALRRLRDEWGLLGFVLGPPLFRLFRDPEAERRPGPPLVESARLGGFVGRTVRAQGLVATYRHVFTHDGRPLQFITLEDEHGLAEVTLFPGACGQVPYLTMGPWLATGTVEEQHGVVTLTAQRFERLGAGG
jgi:error-prone DNA polymerase